MKIFLDTANIKEIHEAASWGVLDGVATNPTTIAREGRDLAEVTALPGNGGGIRGDPIENTPAGGLVDLFDVGGVQEDFHNEPPFLYRIPSAPILGESV